MSSIFDAYEEFKALVDADVRNTGDEQARAMLRRPEMVDRWYQVLLGGKKAVEHQLASRKADHHAKKMDFLSRGKDALDEWREIDAKYARWRSGALRAMQGYEDRLAEARSLRSQQAELEALRQERHHLYEEFSVLRNAVVLHREHICTEDCDERCPADETLWRILDEAR